MKTILIILAALGAVSGGATLAYFNYQAPPTTEVVILRDVTEPFTAQPNAGEVLTLYDLNGEHRWNGARFTFSEISDLSLNRVRETSIDAANKWLSNELERDKKVKQFESNVSAIVAGAFKDTVIGREQSSVYLSIARQLEHLSRSDADQRVLIVYSDLMENTQEVSFYNDRVLAQINERPEKIVQAWEDRRGLPPLAGIEVFLIYQPSNTEEDAAYRVVSGFYRKLLEDKGASVSIAANLLNN